VYPGLSPQLGCTGTAIACACGNAATVAIANPNAAMTANITNVLPVFIVIVKSNIVNISK
jgi:hypothetical protein